MDNQRIRVALIGCGDHAREVLLPTLLLSEAIEVVALCDDSTERLGLACSLCLTAKTSPRFEQLCCDPSVDAIVVAASPQVHVSAATLALNNGKHVFVEKPIAPDAHEAEKLASLAASRSLIAMVGHNFRFAPSFDRVKAVMGDPAFGRPALMEIRYLASKPRGDRWELHSPQRSFLLSHGTHALDIAIDLLGDRLKVDSATIRERNGAFFAAVHLSEPQGCECSLTLTNGAPHFDLGLTIVGDNSSMIEVRGLREVRDFLEPDQFKRVGHVWVPSTLANGFIQSGYAGEIASFASAIQNHDSPHPSFSDSAIVMSLIEDILSISSSSRIVL